MKINLDAVLTLTAIALLTTACQSKPKTATPQTIVKRDLVEAAKADAEKTPNFENITNLGIAYSNAGKHDEAIPQFQHALQLSPNSPLAHNNLCSEFNAVGRLNEAIPLCEQALKLQPGFILAKNNLDYSKRAMAAAAAHQGPEAKYLDNGMALYSKNDFKGSIKEWEKVGKKTPAYAFAQNNIASAYIHLKDFSRAKVALDRALKLQPTNTLFNNNARWLASEANSSSAAPKAKKAGSSTTSQ